MIEDIPDLIDDEKLDFFINQAHSQKVKDILISLKDLKPEIRGSVVKLGLRGLK